MYWATDLLPHEFNYSDAEHINESNVIHYIGSIGENHPFSEFKALAERMHFNVHHHDPWTHPVSYEDNIKLMKESYCVPDFRSHGDASKRAEYGKMNGTNHLDIGYIPCRVLKAISYGRTGITNSKRVKELLGEFVEYSEKPADVFEISERRKRDIEWRNRCMKHVAENHTFLHRVRDLARALQMKSYQTTCVSAMYDIGREKVDGRSIYQYKEWITKTLKTIQDPFVLYLDKSLGWKEYLLQTRSSIGPIQIIETSLEDIPMWTYRSQVLEILKSESFKGIQKYKNDITNLIPEYCLIQYSKFGWLENALKRGTFNSEQFIWIDAGFSKFYNTDAIYECRLQSEGKFIIQADDRIRYIPNITYDNYIGTNECIFHGWLWVVSKDLVVIVKEFIIKLWEEEMLKKGRIDNEQIALALIYKTNNDIFNVIMSEGDTPSIFSKSFIMKKGSSLKN